MMNKFFTLPLFFVTLLALFLNLCLVLEVLRLSDLFVIINSESNWFIGSILCFALFAALTVFVFSEKIARFVLGVAPIHQPSSYLEKWLIKSVKRQSRQLGISVPKVGIFYTSDLNAFSTGTGKNSAMVVLSSGLLETMDEHELDAVIGHELAHIANGDMFSLAVTQGLVVSVTELPARLSGFLIDALIFRGNAQGGVAYHSTYWVCMLLMGMLPHFIVAWFSRMREFAADNVSISLNGADKLLSALKRLSLNKSMLVPAKKMTALGINNMMLEQLFEGMGNVKSIFSSHPSLNKRIRDVEALLSQKDI